MVPIPNLNNNGLLDALGNPGDPNAAFNSLVNQADAQSHRLDSFAIPDLSQSFPGLDNVPFFNIVNKASDLTGAPVTGSASGQIPRLNPNNLERLAVQADTLGYNTSNEDLANRFSEAPAAQQYNVNSAISNLAGKRDPFLTEALKQSGLGDIDFGEGEFTQARNMGMPIASKEARDRTYFYDRLHTLRRPYGLNATDIERIALANTNGINMQALGLAQGRQAQALSNVNTSAAQNAAIISSLGQLGGAAIRGFGSSSAPNYSSPTLIPGYYQSGYGYQVPQGYTSDAYSPYSGNFYDASGNYAGNSYTGEGSFFGG